MLIRKLKASTSVLMALSLAQPLPLMAQEVEPTEPQGICADGNEPPCAEGVELILPEPEDGAVEDALTEQPVDEVRTEQAAEELPTETQDVPVEVAPAEEDAVEAEATSVPAEEQTGEDVPAETEIAEEPIPEIVPEEAPPERAQSEPIEDAPAEATAQDDAPVVEDAPPEEVTSEASLPEETEPIDTAQDAPAAEAQEQQLEETTTNTETDEPSDVVLEAEGTLETEGGLAAEGTLETEGSITAQEDRTETGELGETVSDETTANDEPATEEAQQVLDLLGDEAEGADGETAAAASATDENAEATATVETEVTEEDSRQSDEDFATSASGDARTGNDDDDGLSDFERAALIGLGTLAVGAILSNGDEVVSNTGDRVVVRRGEDDYYVLKDDDTLLRQPGSTVRTESFGDGSTRTTVTREDGTQIVTIRDAAGRVLRRTSVGVDSRSVVLIDDTETYAPVQEETLPEPVVREVTLEETDPLALRLALERAAAADVGRSFSLRQIREIERVRKLVPEIALDTITFETGSAAVQPSEAEELLRLGDLMAALIEDNPREVFLIEGHTDAVGSASFNLALSDRRAESVALALTEYFDVPPENMVVQGYGESDLKIETLEDERQNRRVTVRRITPLLDQRLAQD